MNVNDISLVFAKDVSEVVIYPDVSVAALAPKVIDTRVGGTLLPTSLLTYTHISHTHTHSRSLPHPLMRPKS